MTVEIIEEELNLPACVPIMPYKDLKHEDWLQLRTRGIGGSDAGGILSMSKYSSPLSVWMDKTGRSTPDDLSDNEAIWFGNNMEAIIRREFVAPYIKEKLGLEVEVIDPAYMYRSKDNPFMTINPARS